MLNSGTHQYSLDVQSTTPAEIVARLPDNAPLGEGSLRVETEAGASKPYPVRISMTAPGLYSVNGKGWGQGRIELLQAGGQRAANSLTMTASAGQLATLQASGVGTAANLAIVVGGLPATGVRVQRNVEPGLDEIQFRVPQHVPAGCFVPLYARAAGAPSNVVTIAIGPNGAGCRMPVDEMAPPRAERLGVAGIARTAMLYTDERPLTTFDEAFGAFIDLPAAGQASSPLLSIPPAGKCTMYTGSYQSGLPDFRSFPDALLGMLEGRGLDAGPALSLQGGEQNAIVPATGRGGYWVRLGLEEAGVRSRRPLFFSAPSYTFSSRGGADIGRLEVQLAQPVPFEWSNVAQTAIVDRARGAEVEWKRMAGGIALVFAVSADPSSTAASICLCSAKPESGRARLAPELLSYFPKTQDIAGPPSSLLFVVWMRIDASRRNTPKGLDDLWAITSFARGRRVTYR